MGFHQLAGAAFRALTAGKTGPSLYDVCDPLLLNGHGGDAHLAKFAQLGQVFITLNNSNKRILVNASGRALIKTGQSCNVAVPLTAVQYGSAGTVVQVVKRSRIETRRVETGLMSGGQIEIKDGLVEGDDVVARAGALLREGDPVRPVTAAANTSPERK